MSAFISTELIHRIPHTNHKAWCLYTDLAIFCVVPKWYPPSLSSLGTRTPSNGSVIAKEIGNTWRLASPNSTLNSQFYLRGIHNDRWVFVAAGLQAAVFVIGICRGNGGRGWQAAALALFSNRASCNYRCFSGKYPSLCSLFLEHFLMQMSTLPPIVPLTTTSNRMSYQRQDQAQHPISIFLRIITVFSLLLHIISLFCTSSLPSP